MSLRLPLTMSTFPGTARDRESEPSERGGRDVVGDVGASLGDFLGDAISHAGPFFALDKSQEAFTASSSSSSRLCRAGLTHRLPSAALPCLPARFLGFNRGNPRVTEPPVIEPARKRI